VGENDIEGLNVGKKVGSEVGDIVGANSHVSSTIIVSLSHPNSVKYVKVDMDVSDVNTEFSKDSP